MVRFLNEIDIDIMGVHEVPAALYNYIIDYFKLSEKYSFYPNDPLLFSKNNAALVSVVIWNKNRLDLVEDINHLSQTNNDFHKC